MTSGLSWPRLTAATCGGLTAALGVLVATGWSKLPPMHPATALGLALGGAAIVYISTARTIFIRSKRSTAVGAAGLLLMAFGVTCTISSLAGTFHAVSVSAAVAVLLLGAATSALAWDVSERKLREPIWVPIGFGLLVVNVRLAFWLAFSARSDTPLDLLSFVNLIGGLTGGVLFGVILHLGLKARLQREMLRNANRKLEKEIAERRLAEDAAQSANRSKSEFLATMSHEIRTPMTGVLGMLDLTLMTELSAEQSDYLLTARSSADSLLSLLNDILDLSKIEAHRLDLAPAPFSIRQCMNDAVRIFAVRAQEKGLELIRQVHEHVPEALVGDPLRLRQVLVNLVGNAIKFTDRGSVSIHVGVQSRTESSLVLQIEVTDTGVGIPAEKQQLIFDPFRQADGSAARRYGGTGLGLTISSRLVQLMGGDISVESELGKGSTFRFTAQMTQVTGQAVRMSSDLDSLAAALPDVEPSKRPLQILLAEDNVVNQKLATALLTKEGHKVVVVGNGQKAVEAATAQAFDLVFMDVQMPEMDGMEATTIIRRAEQVSHRHTPIVAMTAHAMNGDREQCIEAGMDDYLTKPINLADLRRILVKFERVSALSSDRLNAAAC